MKRHKISRNAPFVMRTLLITSILFINCGNKQDKLNADLIRYVMLNDASNVKKCIDKGADVNATYYNKDRTTATDILHKAIENNMANAAIELIKGGAGVKANIMHRNKDGEYVGFGNNNNFRLAAMKNNVDVLKAFLDNGVIISDQKQMGHPIHGSLTANYNESVIDAIEFLLEKGIDVNARNNAGETPLIKASKSRFDIFLLRFALDSKNVKAENDYAPIVKMLLKYGADTFIRDNNDSTALMYALRSSHVDDKNISTLLNEFINKKKKEVSSKQIDRSIKEETKIKKIRPEIIGRWVSEGIPMKGYKALETRIFTFKKDGTFEADERMKGQTSEFTKEDWRFLSWGDYELKGDTIFMYVKKEKCVKQLYHNYKEIKGKMRWEPFVAPTYDSTITDGSKDKYFTFEYIKYFFKKITFNKSIGKR